MMIDNRIRKRIVFFVMLILLLVALAVAFLQGDIPFVAESEMAPPEVPPTTVIKLNSEEGENGVCVGVPILTEKELAGYTAYRYADYSSALRFCGVSVPMDREQGIIYLPQNMRNEVNYQQMQGELTVTLQRCNLYFAPDEAFLQMSDAMKSGHGFKLLVVDEDAQTHMEYQVVFTGLPMLCLDGGFSNFDKDGESALTGTLHMFDPKDADERAYTIKSSRASWHLRGATTSRQPKKSWKIDLIDQYRENVELALCGLGTDDDWVLNAMSLDDTRMKEKLAMDVWNEMAAETMRSDNMSVSRYVEVVINGEYHGLYLLQRRIDEQYLCLEQDELLFKGKNTWSIRKPEDGYELEYSPMSAADSYRLIESWSKQEDVSVVDVDNFIDVNLFIQWGSMQDNTSYNNIYYVMYPKENGYGMYMVPWDTDYSMGVLWYNDFFDYQLEMSAAAITERVEYNAMKQQYPQLESEMASRWMHLREKAFSEIQIEFRLQGYRAEICDSGAFARDRAKWGTFYGEQDNLENLCRFFEIRLAYLDEYYHVENS